MYSFTLFIQCNGFTLKRAACLCKVARSSHVYFQHTLHFPLGQLRIVMINKCAIVMLCPKGLSFVLIVVQIINHFTSKFALNILFPLTFLFIILNRTKRCRESLGAPVAKVNGRNRLDLFYFAVLSIYLFISVFFFFNSLKIEDYRNRQIN